jgi:sugar phosphate isomerase/epimerase
MRLGTAIYTYLWECTLEEAIDRCSRFGFDTLELMTTPPFLWPPHYGPYERARLRRRLADAGVGVYSLNPTYLDVNIISLNPAIRAASVAELIANLELAAEIGAQVVVVSPGRRHPLIPAPDDEAERLSLDGIARLVRRGEDLGVTVGLENLPSLFATTGAAVRRLAEQIGSPRCRIVFDVANAYMSQDPSEGLREAAPYLALVHYSDTHKHAWGHLPLGMGEVNFAAATDTLREIGFAGPVLLETTFAQDPDGGIRSSLALLDSLSLIPPRASVAAHTVAGMRAS